MQTEISLHECLACFRREKTTVCHLYAALKTENNHFVTVWLVSDRERPFVSCMQPWRQGCFTLSVLGLFQMQKDDSMSVVCSFADRDILCYRYSACFRCGKTNVCQLYAALQTGTFHFIGAGIVSDVERPPSASCTRLWRQRNFTQSTAISTQRVLISWVASDLFDHTVTWDLFATLFVDAFMSDFIGFSLALDSVTNLIVV